MKKENELASLPEEIEINVPWVAKVEISAHQLLVDNRVVATESDDKKLFDFATIAINSLLSCMFDVQFINQDSGEKKYYERNKN